MHYLETKKSRAGLVASPHPASSPCLESDPSALYRHPGESWDFPDAWRALAARNASFRWHDDLFQMGWIKL
jgi:hypothetical protein